MIVSLIDIKFRFKAAMSLVSHLIISGIGPLMSILLLLLLLLLLPPAITTVMYYAILVIIIYIYIDVYISFDAYVTRKTRHIPYPLAVVARVTSTMNTGYFIIDYQF